MTLKQRKLLKHLETSKTLKEASIKAGYSYGARNAYRQNTREHIAKFIHSDPEKIKLRFEDIANRAKEVGDFSNETRATEALARINAMFTDKSEVKQNNPSSITIIHSGSPEKPEVEQNPVNRIPESVNP